MIFNLLIIAYILILGFIYNYKYGKKCDDYPVKKKFIRIISIVLILQSGLRNVAVGSDTYQYFLIFEEAKRTSWKDTFDVVKNYYQLGFGKDPGYLVFQKMIQVVTDEFQVFLLIVAVLFFVALGNFIYKNTSRLNDAIVAFVIYIVLFYSFFSITGIRQTIATAASLYAYELVKRKKSLQFLLLILLASTIHKSVLIFLPFYFIAHIKSSKYLYRIILLLFPLFMIFRNSMVDYLRVVGGYEQYDEFEGAGTYTFTAMFLLISIVALIRSKTIIENNRNSQHFYNAFAIALLFIPLTWVNPNAMRIVQYFSFFMLLFIPEIIYSFDVASKKLRLTMTRFTIIILVILFLKSNWNNPIPYGFFWEEMALGENYR